MRISDWSSDVCSSDLQERQDTFEVGFKKNLGGGNRFSVALFHNKLKDLQREQTFPGGASVIQLIANTSDATIQGLEFEGQMFVTPEFVVNAQLGYVHGEYDVVRRSEAHTSELQSLM